jgi:hypothetical protein
MFPRKLTTSIAAGAAAVAVAIGAYAVGNSSSSGTANAAPPAHSAPAPQVGQVPPSWRPGTGTIVMGAAADEAKAVALATYSGGTVNRVLKLSDGSYAVHVNGTSGPHHIFVSKDFKVTGAA